MSNDPPQRHAHPLNRWLPGDFGISMEKSTLLGVGVKPQSIGKLLSIRIMGEGHLEVYLTPDAARHLADLLIAPNPPPSLPE